ncbi:parallel beta-helix repeat (two copies) [Solimonas aquatica]|uniref:Parallel beta-helix repeat (Two copies) n=1 Tax=Solimonas aquatica TaxID=489703 RepID=A0A1H9GUI5_9GAMM|nr:right-handed parallel beta-helix repeat-containing protein [Solimonas aquatica]SEQ53732.1 parallel beta-helix repeat (two copies) [Solimonas aquatica]
MIRLALRSVGLLSALLLLAPAASAASCTLKLKPGAALQAAVDRLPADKPATVCLAAGEYPLAHALEIRRGGLTLRGAGARSVLRLREGTREPVIVIGDAHNEVPAQAIREVRMEALRVIGADSDGEFTADRPWLSNSAIVVRRGENIVLRKLEVSSCRSACILTERDTRGVRIEDSEISGSVWDGLSFNRSAQILVRGNQIHGNRAAGITVEHLEDSRIEDNRIEANGSHGIYLSDAWRNRFSGNRFIGNRNAGVFLTCSVRYHEPAPVLCWDNSMSQGNVFEHNRFQHNEHGYDVGADDAANCSKPEFLGNIWRDNDSDAPNRDPQPQRFGLCTRSS